MQCEEIKSSTDLAAYIIDCHIDMVENMLEQDSVSEDAFKKQAMDTQVLINWMRQFNQDLSKSRASMIIDKFEGRVENWASSLKC